MKWLTAFWNWLVGMNTPLPTPTADTTTFVIDYSEPEVLLWDTPQHAFHSVRVMCDKAGLSYDEKNLICAVIYQESRFNNKALNHNKNTQGVTVSTDYGICQINDYYHIGKGKTFPSVEYVLLNPDKAVQFMLDMHKTGKLYLWIAFKSGAYKYWLLSNSPMWLLK